MISSVKSLRYLSGVAAVICFLVLFFNIHEAQLPRHLELRQAIKFGSSTRPIVWQVDDLLETDLDPYNRKRSIMFGPYEGFMPKAVAVNESFPIQFRCLDAMLCPTGFSALFVGPTQQFFTTKSERTQHEKLHTFQIADPGTYKVYLWPRYDADCYKYKQSGERWSEHLAKGSPFTLHVTDGSPLQVIDSVCPSTEAILDGRWVHSAELRVSEIFMLGLDPYRQYVTEAPSRLAPYVWLPRTCHVKHRSINANLARVKAKHILFVGDSVLRDPFCLQIFQLAVPNLAGTVCDARDDDHYRQTTKQVTIRYGDLPEEETLMTFKFITNTFGTDDTPPLMDEELKMTPTHVVWNQGLWFQLEQASEQVEYETMKNSSRLLLSLYPNAKHIIRGTTSMIENVDCYDHLVGQDVCVRESDTARRVYEEELLRSPQASLAWMETLKYVDARPETTRDGRHYTQEFKGHEYSAETHPERPRVGETDLWLMDLTFEIWAKHMRM